MICVAFGLPGAGKSSLVKQAVDWECIELDTYTQFGHQLSKRHAWAKEKAEEIVKRRGKCIVDDNHYYSSMRHAYYKLAKKYECGFVQIWCKCSVDEAIRRNSLRSGVERVPDHVILDMDRVFEEPNPKKNHWEKNTIVLDMELCSVFPFDIVSLFMENPIVEGKEKQVIEENIDSKWFDEFEKASRRVLSDFLKSSQRPKSRGYVEKLNSIRRRFVNEKRESFNEFHSEKDSACILNDLISDLRMCFENCEN